MCGQQKKPLECLSRKLLELRGGVREQRTGSWRGWGVSKQDTAAAAQEGRFSKEP